MLAFKFLLIYIKVLLIVTNHVASNEQDCNRICAAGAQIDMVSCRMCVGVRMKRQLPDNLLVSKLIRDDEIVTQSTNVNRCSNNEQWIGNACIPSVSLCPGGYHWNGNACIVQTVTQTAVLVPAPPNTKCHAAQLKLNDQTISVEQSLPRTVMPTYSTSPMCPFGFVWSGVRCIRNPPVCPERYIFHANICHLIAPSLNNVISTTLTPPDNILSDDVKSQQKFIDSDVSMEFGSEHKYGMVNVASFEASAEDLNGQNCCSIMSPRICRRNNKHRYEQWQCYHRKHRRCGDFCTKPNIFLRPGKTSFIEPLLVMPPPSGRLQKLLQRHAYRDTNIGKKIDIIIETNHLFSPLH